MKTSSNTLIAGTDVSDLTEMPLDRLADVANESAEAAMNAAGKALEHAIRCGRALIAAKEKVEHGRWLPWLKTYFDRSPDTAAHWMKLAANSERVRNLEEAPSIRAALRLIADEDAEAAGEPSCEVDDDIDSAIDGNVDADDEAETTPPADTRPARQLSDVVDDAGDTGEDNAGDTDTTPAPEVIDVREITNRLRQEYQILLTHSPKKAREFAIWAVAMGFVAHRNPDEKSRWEPTWTLCKKAVELGMNSAYAEDIKNVMDRAYSKRNGR